MNILLLTSYFEPEQMASPYLDENLYSAFAAQGYQMITYTPTPTRGVDNYLHNEYKQKKNEIKYNGMMKVYRFSMMREKKNIIFRAFRYALCFCKHLYYGLKAKNVDIILLSSTPPIQGLLGSILKKIKRVPFIYTLQDIFPDSLVGTGLTHKNSILWKIGRKIEDLSYDNANKIIVISNEFKNNIIQKGVPKDKIEVIPNWVDENAVIPIKKEDNILYDELKISKEYFNVVYAGNLGNAQNIDIIIDAAQRLKEYARISFIIFGSGGYEDIYKQRVKDLNLKNVLFYPIQAYNKVSYVYSLGDIGIVSCKKGLGGCAMPSKTWSIMAAGRPVLLNFDESELKTIIENNNCGIFTKAGELTDFSNAILKLYNNKDLCNKLGENGRKYILNNLTRSVGTKKYIEVIKNTINESL